MHKGERAMHAVHFDKAYAEQVLRAIDAGQPIPVREGGWSGDNVLMVLGIFHARVMSQEAHSQQVLGPDAAKIAARQHPERREATEARFHRDVADATKFIASLTSAVIDHQYDEAYGPLVQGVVFRNQNRHKSVYPYQGFKRA